MPLRLGPKISSGHPIRVAPTRNHRPSSLDSAIRKYVFREAKQVLGFHAPLIGARIWRCQLIWPVAAIKIQYASMEAEPRGASNAIGVECCPKEARACRRRIKWPVRAMRFKCSLIEARAGRRRFPRPVSAMRIPRFSVETRIKEAPPYMARYFYVV